MAPAMSMPVNSLSAVHKWHIFVDDVYVGDPVPCGALHLQEPRSVAGRAAARKVVERARDAVIRAARRMGQKDDVLVFFTGDAAPAPASPEDVLSEAIVAPWQNPGLQPVHVTATEDEAKKLVGVTRLSMSLAPASAGTGGRQSGRKRPPLSEVRERQPAAQRQCAAGTGRACAGRALVSDPRVRMAVRFGMRRGRRALRLAPAAGGWSSGRGDAAQHENRSRAGSRRAEVSAKEDDAHRAARRQQGCLGAGGRKRHDIPGRPRRVADANGGG